MPATKLAGFHFESGVSGGKCVWVKTKMRSCEDAGIGGLGLLTAEGLEGQIQTPQPADNLSRFSRLSRSTLHTSRFTPYDLVLTIRVFRCTFRIISR